MGISPAQARARDMRSAFRFAACTPADTDLPVVPSFLMFTLDCDVTIKGDDGNAITQPVRAGVQYDWSPARITAVSTGVCNMFFTDGGMA